MVVVGGVFSGEVCVGCLELRFGGSMYFLLVVEVTVSRSIDSYERVDPRPRVDRASPAESDDRSGRVATIPLVLPKGVCGRGPPRAGEE